jgi:tRNA uridine 5-carboxymethylaminomethyl modification enzyme
MRKVLEAQEGLNIKQESVEEILVEKGRIYGIRAGDNVYRAKAVIIATGTFLNGLIHIGLKNFPAGRAGEPPSIRLSESLRKLGLKMGRLKTGTPPRLDGRSIDFSVMVVQDGDIPPPSMSIFTEEIANPQLPCYITYTCEETHRIIMDNLRYSPLYSGRIVGTGPRYCPSIEDKVVRFKTSDIHRTRGH